MSKEPPDLHRRLNKLRAHFRQDDVRRKIEKAALDTKAWLKEGSESFSEDGQIRIDEPWWQRELSETTNPVLLEERGQTFRARVVEHGSLKMFQLMFKGKKSAIPKEFLSPDPWSVVVSCVTDSMTWVIVRELVKRRAAYEENLCNLPSINLRELAKLYRYSPTTAEAKPRDKISKSMVPLGLLQARVNGEYAIEVGVVASEFYHVAYLPLVKEYEGAPLDDGPGPRPRSGRSDQQGARIRTTSTIRAGQE